MDGENKMKYVQCHLRRNATHTTGWIPEKFAVVGKLIDIKEDGEWSKGWTIISAYSSTPLEESYLRERSQDYKHTRKASDI